MTSTIFQLAVAETIVPALIEAESVEWKPGSLVKAFSYNCFTSKYCVADKPRQLSKTKTP